MSCSTLQRAIRRVCASSMSGAVLLLVAQPGFGADAAATEGSNNMEEVVVTAQKRAERAQDVPISLAVMSGAALDSSSTRNVADALAQTPGVAIIPVVGDRARINIRGVTAGGAMYAGSSPVGYYLDSVPFSLVRSSVVPDANAYDLDRIEVLRGPQGTLYGASALNGVVRVLTNAPDLKAADFKARTSVAGTEDGGGSWGADLAINVPIVEDMLAARVVMSSAHTGGWIDTPLKNNFNDGDTKTVRAKFLAEPSDSLSILVSGMHWRGEYGASPSAGRDGFYPGIQDVSLWSRYSTGDLKISWDLPSFSISSSTSYLNFRNAGKGDSSPQTRPPVPQLATALWARVFAEEINLTSNLRGPWRWSAGAYYRNARDTNHQVYALLPAPLYESLMSRSTAVFGEFGRRFLEDKFEFGLGARYFRDDVDMDQLIPYGPPGTALLPRISNTYTATTPRVVLSWFPSRELTMYASYSEGFRSGFPQQTLVYTTAPEFPSVKPDKLHNYEVGGKGSLFAGLMTFDASVYYMKWNDIQQNLSTFIPGISSSGPTTARIAVTVNGSSASGVGTDLSLAFHPSADFSFGLNFSWNDLVEDEDVTTAVAGPNGSQLRLNLYDEGWRIDSSPSITGGAFLKYGFGFGASGWSGAFDLSGRYISEQRSTTAPTATTSRLLAFSDSMSTARASFTLTAPSRWRLMAYCDNCTDNRGVISAAPIQTNPYGQLLNRPRTVGLQLDYSYQ